MESVLPIPGSAVTCCVTLSLRQIAPGFSGSQKRVKPLVKSLSIMEVPKSKKACLWGTALP